MVEPRRRLAELEQGERERAAAIAAAQQQEAAAASVRAALDTKIDARIADAAKYNASAGVPTPLAAAAIRATFVYAREEAVAKRDGTGQTGCSPTRIVFPLPSLDSAVEPDRDAHMVACCELHIFDWRKHGVDVNFCCAKCPGEMKVATHVAEPDGLKREKFSCTSHGSLGLTLLVGVGKPAVVTSPVLVCQNGHSAAMHLEQVLKQLPSVLRDVYLGEEHYCDGMQVHFTRELSVVPESCRTRCARSPPTLASRARSPPTHAMPPPPHSSHTHVPCAGVTGRRRRLREGARRVVRRGVRGVVDVVQHAARTTSPLCATDEELRRQSGGWRRSTRRCASRPTARPLGATLQAASRKAPIANTAEARRSCADRAARGLHIHMHEPPSPASQPPALPAPPAPPTPAPRSPLCLQPVVPTLAP